MAVKNSTDVGFKRIEIFHEQSLGIGAYGKVCRAWCDNLVCAAKILHPTLVQVDRSTLPLQRFERECELMSAIRHPNIVQCLGCHRDVSTQLPVLLMELMNDNLTCYLERSPDQPVPYDIQVNICYDVTLALVFLHSNNIIHRDLSSNNVLLTCSFQAKVADFGMAKLSDLNCQSCSGMTICPGTNVYMPPEAVQDKPEYTEKIDCFSLGVIAIQIITRQFPNPGDRCIRHNDEQATLTIVPEIRRRHSHISQIDPMDPILPIAHECLQDSPVSRPSAQQLYERFADLKLTPRYTECTTSVEVDNSSQISDHISSLRFIQQIHRYESDLAEKHHTINFLRRENHLINQQQLQSIFSLQRENQHLSQQQLQSSHQIENLQQENSNLRQQIQWLHQQIREKDQLEAQKDIEVGQEILRFRQQLEYGRQEIRTKNQRIETLESQAEAERQRHIQQIHGLQEIILSERRFLNDSSVHISQKNQIIAHKEELLATKAKEIHLLEQQLHHLRRYRKSVNEETSSHVSVEVSIRSPSLEHQPISSVSLSSSGRVSVLKVSANVEVPPTCTNQEVRRFELKWNSKNKRAPCGMAAHCSAVVCGKVVYFQPTDTNYLYTYNSEADNWSQLPDVKNRNCSMAIVNDFVTAIGGSKLIRGRSRKLYSLTCEEKGMKWTKILPPMQTKRSQSCALCIGTDLIVAGGEGKNGKALATVEILNTNTKQWSYATDLPEPLWGASSIVCGNQVFVVGGVNVHVQPTRSVYKCAVDSLLQSCHPTLQSSLWDRVSDLPVTGPTCVSLCERLILVGGEDSKTRSTAIHMYDQTADEWIIISHMSSGRNQCFAAVVPDNQLIIVGGWIDTTQDQTASDVVEIAMAEILDVH